MDEFFKYDPLTAGSKGLVFVGEKILIYRRDYKTTNHPNELDLPGGGPEDGETPFETFKREVMEEFEINISSKDIVYVRKYPSKLEKGKFAYFPVVKLPAEMEANITLGDEGTEFLLIDPEDYVARDDAWVVFQERTQDFLSSFS